MRLQVHYNLKSYEPEDLSFVIESGQLTRVTAVIRLEDGSKMMLESGFDSGDSFTFCFEKEPENRRLGTIFLRLTRPGLIK